MLRVSDPGYVRVDVEIESASGNGSLLVRDLQIASATRRGCNWPMCDRMMATCFTGGGGGRRFICAMTFLAIEELQYAYSEVTVPKGQDTIGSFFMANGFGEGYFGFQVNSSSRTTGVVFSLESVSNG